MGSLHDQLVKHIDEAIAMEAGRNARDGYAAGASWARRR